MNESKSSTPASDRFYRFMERVVPKATSVVATIGAVSGLIYGWRTGGYWKGLLWLLIVGMSGIVAVLLLMLIAFVLVGVPLAIRDKRRA
jgi:Mg/Co/Ni transporter MgtE